MSDIGMVLASMKRTFDGKRQDDTQEAIMETFDEWQEHPETVPHEEHEKNCLSHRYFKTERGSYDRMPCPVCYYQEKLARLRKQLEESGIGERYLDSTFDELEQVDPVPRIIKACSHKNIDRILDEGESLLLYGPPGQGKTQLAAMVAKAAITYGHEAKMVNIGRLSVQVRHGYDNKDGSISEEGVIHGLSEVPFLILDDLGAGETDSAKIEKRLLYFISEERQNRRLPSVLTTNLDKAGFRLYLGSRILNRFMPLTTIKVDHGKNFRVPDRESIW